jgi:hypothetical protein
MCFNTISIVTDHADTAFKAVCFHHLMMKIDCFWNVVFVWSVTMEIILKHISDILHWNVNYRTEFFVPCAHSAIWKFNHAPSSIVYAMFGAKMLNTLLEILC